MLAELESRAALYSALALGFAYPEGGEDFESLLAHLQSAIRDSQSAISNPRSLTPAEEYTFLFARQTPCPPYESSYCPAGMEQNLADIAGFYRAFGLQVAPAARERVDHIGSELEFMAVLCAKEARARQRGLTEQAEICRAARRAFLTDHLGRWAPAFAARVKDRARLPLYPALAETLLALLSREAEALGATLDPMPAAIPEEPAAVEESPAYCR